MKPKRLEMRNVPSAGLQIHGDMPAPIDFPEGTMKARFQGMLIGCAPWIQFPNNEWDEMLEEVFQEMVDLWNAKHAGKKPEPNLDTVQEEDCGIVHKLVREALLRQLRTPKCWRQDRHGNWFQDVPVFERMHVWLPYTSLTPKELSQLAGAPVPHRAIVRRINGVYDVAIIRHGSQINRTWHVDEAYACREDARQAAKEVTR